MKAHPEKQRTKEEYEEMDKSNKITFDLVINFIFCFEFSVLIL